MSGAAGTSSLVPVSVFAGNRDDRQMPRRAGVRTGCLHGFARGDSLGLTRQVVLASATGIAQQGFGGLGVHLVEPRDRRFRSGLGGMEEWFSLGQGSQAGFMPTISP